MDSALLQLPIELIVTFLEVLDARALATCRLICRMLRTLIDTTANLKYTIELDVLGQEDGPGQANPAERLEQLIQHQKAWDSLSWTKDYTVPMLRGGAWELFGNVLAQNDKLGCITFRQLPSQHRGIEETVWKIGPGLVDFQIRDFGIDPSQDLLVLVESPKWSGSSADHTSRFHIRSMSTGNAHPLARKPGILAHVHRIPDVSLSYTIQICGDYLGVLFNTRAQRAIYELVIWDWKNDRTETWLVGGEIRSFSFITENHIVVTILDDIEFEPSLKIINFKELDGGRQHMDVLSACTLSYPGLALGVSPLTVIIRSDPDPTWKPSAEVQAPFHLARDNKLFVISIWVQKRTTVHCIVHFVPLAVLCAHAHLSTSNTTVGWNQWAGNGTRMFRHPQPDVHTVIWACYVYGSRYVTLDSKEGEDETTHVLMYDFNQAALRRELSKGEALMSVNTYAPPDGSTICVTSEDVIPDGEFFEQEIRTSLPYRVRSRSLGTEEGHYSPMCSEDCLVMVNSDGGPEQLGEYRVLVF